MKVKIVLEVASDDLLYDLNFLDDIGIRREFIQNPKTFINESIIKVARIYQPYKKNK